MSPVKERHPKDHKKIGKDKFTEESDLKMEGYHYKGGYFGGHYRGNHRSHTRGKGIMAFFRNNWMKRYRGG